MNASPTLQRAHADDDRGGRAAALLDLGFDDGAARCPLIAGLELEHFGLEQDALEQLVDALALDRRNRARQMVSPPQSSGMRPFS